MKKNPSRRARRMDRRHKMAKGAPINLVSLMDILTILVFFLLFNSTNVPQLPGLKDLVLPKSTAQKVPQDTLVLAITREIVLLQGKEVARIADVQASADDVIESLLHELEFWRSNRQLRTQAPAADTGAAITIMGDENVSYALLHKILTTCQQANYTEIAFAAHQLANPEP